MLPEEKQTYDTYRKKLMEKYERMNRKPWGGFKVNDTSKDSVEQKFGKLELSNCQCQQSQKPKIESESKQKEISSEKPDWTKFRSFWQM